ncbi:MAG: hypothetical protein EBT08_21885 [Betaproteobacteria bacterium]|nr:hypothetical protein [Betaproteobacteria bacterium]
MQFRTSLGGETVPLFMFYAPSPVSVEHQKPVPGAMASQNDSLDAFDARPANWIPPIVNTGNPSVCEERTIAVEAWSLADGSNEPHRTGRNPHVTAVLRISRHYFGLSEGDKQQAA